jgi:dephospho-CoA kinase
MNKLRIPEDTRVVVNLIGWPGSGKSTHADQLVHEGFDSIYRASDVMRAYAQEHGITLKGRADYKVCHERLLEGDPDAIVRPVLESSVRLLCVDGLRAPAFASRLKREVGMYTVALTLPDEVGFRRVKADQGRPAHRRPDTLEEYLNDIKPDEYSSDGTMVSMRDMFAMADVSIDASRSYDTVHGDIVRTIEDRACQTAN